MNRGGEAYDRARDHCAAQPGAVEDFPWGEAVWTVRGKIFDFLGRPAPDAERLEITAKPDSDEVEALLGLAYVRRAAYVGRYGWVTVTIENEEQLGLALDLISTSHAQKVGKQR